MDDGTFGYVLSSFGFNVETDVGINGCFAPFWLLWTHYLIWPLGLISDGSDGATLLLWLLLKTCLGETSVLNGFVLSVSISAPRGLFLVSRFENSDSAQFNSLFSAKF